MLPPKLRTYNRLDLAAKEYVRMTGAPVTMHGPGWLCNSTSGAHGKNVCDILAQGWLRLGVKLRNTGHIIDGDGRYWVVLQLDHFVRHLTDGRYETFVALIEMPTTPTIEERSGAHRALADAYDYWQQRRHSPLRAYRPPFLVDKETR